MGQASATGPGRGGGRTAAGALQGYDGRPLGRVPSGAGRGAGSRTRPTADAVGGLDERALLLLGAAIYWCEGAKSKPWRRAEKVQFINSDPGLLALFLSFLEACGVDRAGPTYRVSIHESADAEAAVRWWQERLRLPVDRFQRSVLKRHNPATVRKNTGDDYHGCLVISVPRSRALYWRIEGMIAELFRLVDGEQA